MNYKIRITDENQAIVKRIADENGMNPNNFEFYNTKTFYIIKDNKFFVGNIGYKENIFMDYTELATEQFIEMFDKKETEMDRIANVLASVNNPTEESPKVETKWQPKRDDRVLVWCEKEELAVERIFFDKAGKNILAMGVQEYDDYINGNDFFLEQYFHMKPLPTEQSIEDKVEVASEIYAEENAKDDNISYHNLFSPLKYAFINGAKWQSEQPIETDFKSKFEKVIELIEKRIDESVEKMKSSANDNSFQDALAWKIANQECGQLLNQIKQL